MEIVVKYGTMFKNNKRREQLASTTRKRIIDGNAVKTLFKTVLRVGSVVFHPRLRSRTTFVVGLTTVN